MTEWPVCVREKGMSHDDYGTGWGVMGLVVVVSYIPWS